MKYKNFHRKCYI